MNMATPIDLQDRLARHGIDPSTVSLDHLLGRRVQLVQFIRGYRAAVDPVLLAAA
ncbi:MAG TPA: methyltransferase small, partial [Tistrella mobilis]|nr:methyltransferase small [Tistrella mobilis]